MRLRKPFKMVSSRTSAPIVKPILMPFIKLGVKAGLEGVKIEMVPVETSSDYIPASQAVTDSEIRDIFVFNTETNSILSIPYDKDSTLIEFMEANPSQLKPYYSVCMMSLVYKIYIIDYAYLKQKPQLARLKKNV